MIEGNKARKRGMRIAADVTLDRGDLVRHAEYLIATAGVHVTLPSPAKTYANVTGKIVNDTDGPSALYCDAGFVGGRNMKVIPPRSTVRFFIVCQGSSSQTWKWDIEAIGKDSDMLQFQEWTPTFTWATGTVATSDFTESSYYWIKDGTFFFTVYLTSSDLDGSTDLTITLPTGVFPDNVAMEVPCQAQIKVDTTWTNPLAYIDCAEAAAEDRIVRFRNFPTATADKAVIMAITGFCELSGWTAFTPDLTWGTADPTTGLTTAGRCKVIGNTMFVIMSTEATDSNGCSSLTMALPLPTPDRNGYASIAAEEFTDVDGSTPLWEDPMGYLDLLASTGATRLMENDAFTTATDAQAIKYHAAFSYELNAAWQSFTPTWSWTQDGTIAADPATPTTTSFYSVDDGVCSFWIYWTSADGNDCTDVTITLPFNPDPDIPDQALNAYQKQDSTETDPYAYIDVSAEKIKFRVVDKLDDGDTTILRVAGCYPVA